MVVVTGGAGFIGSNFVLDWLAVSNEPVINLDALTYAGNLENLASLQGDARHIFVKGDIGDFDLVARLLSGHRPRAIVNFAAESHVDRSIHGPGRFSFNTDTHLVRRMPNGRFAHINGPVGLIGWITRRDDSGAYSPVTTISQLIPYQDFEPCPALCVTTTATVGIAGTYKGPLGEITFRPDETYVLDAFGQRTSSNYKIEGDRVFLNNPVTGKAPWYVLRAPCLHEPTFGGELFCQGREPR